MRVSKPLYCRSIPNNWGGEGMRLFALATALLAVTVAVSASSVFFYGSYYNNGFGASFYYNKPHYNAYENYYGYYDYYGHYDCFGCRPPYYNPYCSVCTPPIIAPVVVPNVVYRDVYVPRPAYYTPTIYSPSPTTVQQTTYFSGSVGNWNDYYGVR